MFDNTAGWDAGLDDAQLTAVTHGDDPLVIVAGAGTGKTRTLTSRVAWLIERGVPAERILLLTFTRRAADDMLARAESLIGSVPGTRRPQGGTFHAVAHRTVAAHAASLGLAEGFILLDPSDVADVMDLMRGTSSGCRGTRPACPRSTHAGRGVLALHQHAAPVARGAGHRLPLVRAPPRLDRRAVQGVHGPQADASLSSTSTTCSSSGGPCSGTARSVGTWPARTTTCWSTSTRTSTASRSTSCRSLRPDGLGLTVVGDDAQADLRLPGGRLPPPGRPGGGAGRR